MLWAGQRGWGFGVGGAKAPLLPPCLGRQAPGSRRPPGGSACCGVPALDTPLELVNKSLVLIFPKCGSLEEA